MNTEYPLIRVGDEGREAVRYFTTEDGDGGFVMVPAEDSGYGSDGRELIIPVKGSLVNLTI